jgi:hypothetical protein
MERLVNGRLALGAATEASGGESNDVSFGTPEFTSGLVYSGWDNNQGEGNEQPSDYVCMPPAPPYFPFSSLYPTSLHSLPIPQYSAQLMRFEQISFLHRLRIRFSLLTFRFLLCSGQSAKGKVTVRAVGSFQVFHEE